MFKDKVLLVVAPHPDDEVLGCGGLINKVKRQGGKVYVMILTVGNSKMYGGQGESNQNSRKIEAEDVMKFLNVDGFDICFTGENYHLMLDALPQKTLIDMIENESKIAVTKIKPDIVALPFWGSINQDHRAVFQAGLTVCRSMPRNIRNFQNLVISYEDARTVWSAETFHPNLYVDIAEFIDKKCEALSLYKSQIRDKFHFLNPETVRVLAMHRGREVSLEAAEAFVIHRSLI